MELKVWVEGIQRVVCGATYGTTCQDVVLALAHAMGRTGRFTLVERWRDSERPLTPHECPLHALHKWGEYAAEVRFFLVQAEVDHPPTQQQQQQQQHHHHHHQLKLPQRQRLHQQQKQQHHQLYNRSEKDVGKIDKCPAHYSATQSPKGLGVNQPLPETIKRSSTFSGAHQGNYTTALPPSLSSSSSSSSTSSDHHRHKLPSSSTTATTTALNSGQRRVPPGSIPNGDVTAASVIPPTSSSTSSLGSTHRGGGPTPRGPAASAALIGDVREIHPANMPGSMPVFPNQTRDQHHHHNHHHHPSVDNHRQGLPSSQPHQPASGSMISQQRMQTPFSSHPQHPASTFQQPHPTRHLQYPPSPRDQPHPTVSQNQLSRPIQHWPDHTKDQGSPRPVATNLPIPAPRHHSTSPPTSSEYENLPAPRHIIAGQLPPQQQQQQQQQQPQPQHHQQHPQPTFKRREQSGERLSQRNKQNTTHQPVPHDSQQTGAYHRNNGTNMFNIRHKDEPESCRDSQSEREPVLGHVMMEQPSHLKNQKQPNHQVPNSHSVNVHENNKTNSESYRDKLVAESYTHSRQFGFDVDCDDNATSVTVDARTLPSASSRSRPVERTFPMPRESQGIPILSKRTDKALDVDQLSKSLPASGINSLWRSEGGKVNFVESALMRQQRSVDSANSAVHTRQLSADSGSHPLPRRRSSSSGGSARQLSSRLRESAVAATANGSEVRTQTVISDSTLTTPMGTVQGETSQSQVEFPMGGTARSSFSASNENITHHHRQLQSPSKLPSGKPLSPMSPTFLSISSSRHTSAFKEVSPRSSRQGSASSPREDPVAYNLDHQNFDQQSIASGHGLPEAQHGKAHSRQASLEVEEYDLDLNFPDVLQREGQVASGVPKMGRTSDSRLPLEYRLETGDVAQAVHSDQEYMQLARQVKMQQEKIRMQEAQINDANMEIAGLEEKDVDCSAHLEVVTSDLRQLEAMEVELMGQLGNLESVEWINVLDGERKREVDLRSQMKAMQEKLVEMDSQLEQLREGGAKKAEELDKEKERLDLEHSKQQEVERKALAEVRELKGKLSDLDQSIEKQVDLLEHLEEDMQNLEEDLHEGEKKIEEMEEELRCENMKDFQAHPVLKEEAASTKSGFSREPTAAEDVSALGQPDSGEAILKILEGHLAPRLSPSLTDTNDDSSIPLVQQAYKSSLAAKNPNGVWV